MGFSTSASVFFLVVVAGMDMGLLGWDGRVWVCCIDKWVYVAGVFFSGGGGYGFTGLRVTKRKRERNIYWRIKK